MAQSRKRLAELAVSAALRLRQQSGIAAHAALSIYDLCERLHVAVRYADIPSMEGVYLPQASPRPTIIVSSLRPAGRQAMTCGHELGHHVFGHGEQWDELVEHRTESRTFQPHEYQADIFAAMLQMPKLAVDHAFSRRNLDPRQCLPEAVYSVTNWFGVGYSSLVTHMSCALKIIDAGRADQLRHHQPKDIRAAILGSECPQNLIMVDVHWTDRPIDAQVEDLIVLPPGTCLEGCCIRVLERSPRGTLAQSAAPGIGRAHHPQLNWSAFIRVARKGYVGRAPYRFDEEVEDAG